VDARQIGELRSWARRLEARADDEELRAAGKAILLLAGEVERLEAESNVLEGGSLGSDEEPPPGRADAPSSEEGASLRSRLRRTFGYGDS
jgi:hypothetical protein